MCSVLTVTSPIHKNSSPSNAKRLVLYQYYVSSGVVRSRNRSVVVVTRLRDD